MIVNTGQTLFRYIGKQGISIGDQPALSFDLQTNTLSEDVSFGFCERAGWPDTIDRFDLNSGFVKDSLNRIIGTYQSGINNFNYDYARDPQNLPTSNFRINERLIYVNRDFPDLSDYSVIDSFYLANNGTVPVDFNLQVNGFHPPISFGRLKTDDYRTFTGEMYHPTLENYNYRLMAATPNYQFLTSIGIPSGGYVFDGSGNFVLSGSASPSQIIPVTLDFDFGQYIVNYEVSSTGAAAGTGIGGGGDGFYLNLEGTGNEIIGNGELNYDVYFYSTNQKEITIEMGMSSGSSVVLLSGNATGARTYEGMIYGSGYLYSDGITGYADFSQPWNAGFNPQYQTIPAGINVRENSSDSIFKYFTGEYTYNYYGIPMSAPYYDYESEIILLKTYTGTGYGSITINYTGGNFGVYYTGVLTGQFLQQGNPPFPFQFPNIASGTGNFAIVGQGQMSQYSGDIPFLGYGMGGVTPSAGKREVEATGVITYTGDLSIGYNWDSISYGFGVVYPQPNPGVNSSYSLFSGQSAYGRGYYGTELILATGGLGEGDYFYPRGMSYITIESTEDGITDFYDHYLVFTGQGEHPIDGPVTRTWTGNAFGYAFIQAGTYPGPVFSGGQDSNLYSYNNFTNYYKSGSVSEVVYGRGIISGRWISTGGAAGGTGIGLWFPPVPGVPAVFPKQWTEVVNGYPVDFSAARTLFVNKVTPQQYLDNISPQRIIRTKFQNDSDIHGGIYLTFDESPDTIYKSGVFDGFGWTTGVVDFPFDLYTGDGTTFLSFREFNYTGERKYIKAGIPMGPGFNDFIAKVVYSAESPVGSSDRADLKIYTSTYTGQVIISGYGNAV